MAHNASVSSLKDIFIVLGSLYALLLIIAIVQLFRIHQIRKFPIRRFSTQKTFLFLLSLTCLLRTVFFFVITFVETNSTFDMGKFSVEPFTMIDDFGCITFFTTFCLLILFWIEIVYHSRNKTRTYRAKVRPIFLVLILIVYVLQVAIWVLIYTLKNHRELVDKIDNTFYSVLSLGAGLGFFYYGIKLTLKLRRNPINSPGKKRKLIEVILFTLLCTACFIGRSLIFLTISFYRNLDINYINVFIYYGITEILPSVFVIILFRKMPPRKSIVHESIRVESGEYDSVQVMGINDDLETSKQPLLSTNTSTSTSTTTTNTNTEKEKKKKKGIKSIFK
ncbi:hypothetical protein DLAC_02621 [Tieghemostelium lacteum]|uniref:THH1/TOM1/TOM3 domain-containing protein n=1 Tax=Tieghemostelium lacteum TaxID=361077 RepID=A0A152A313_TIELA|nr:hypothetical protein DLAC_02621 [Tieghemostelium lacteum]|eukprot:KYR00600.1 hypothetical protein DLAC_02621 [Tieghemostelium lacteum]